MLGKNLIATILTQIPIFMLGVVSGVFSTRILGDDAKGAFSIFQANTQLFVLVFSLGIQTGIVYFVSSKKIKEDTVLGMTAFIFLISTVALAVLLTISYFSNTCSYLLTKEYSGLEYLGSVFLMFVFNLLNSVIAAIFQAHSKFRTINTITLANSIINALVFCILFFSINTNEINTVLKFNLVLYTTLGMLILNTLLWVYFLKRELYIKPKFDFKIKNELKLFITYNILIYIGMFINFFNYRLDLWIVNTYADQQELSYYSLAANINQIILIISVTISSVIFPNLSGKSDEERAATFIRLSRITFTFFIFLTVTAYLLSSFIIPFMYGKEFIKTVFPFQLLLPGILFSCITQIFSIFLVSSNKNIFNIIACSVGLVFTVTLDLVLIPKYSINGASIATSITYFAIFATTYVFILKQIKHSTINLFIPSRNEFAFLRKTILKTAK